MLFLLFDSNTEPNGPRPVKTGKHLFLNRPSLRKSMQNSTDLVARRLIAGALGVRPKKKSQEEQATDRLKLQQAREQREAERLLRDERQRRADAVWND